MKKRLVAFLIVLAFLNVAIIAFGILSIQGAPVDSLEPLRIDDKFRAQDFAVNGEKPSILPTSSSPRTSYVDGYYEIGDYQYWIALDDFNGYYFWSVFQLRAMSYNTEIWVQIDLSYPEGDSRAYPVVTDEQLEYLLLEFDSNIYPIETTFFGVPDDHDGDEGVLYPEDYMGSDRNVILVSNIRDTAYYYDWYPYYIAGFYSPTLEFYLDRNIISIDSHNWEDRIGPDVPRPYLYEALIAHEYQHLIHDDYNTNDATFMNEGCSMIAEFLCGYPIAWGDINSYLATPDNGLMEWGDQGDINILADYGQVLLWTLYLHDHFGGAAFISHFVQSGVPGIVGIEASLAAFGYHITFDEIYHDWRIANLIHTDHPGNGKYNYDSIDLGSVDANPIRVYEVTEKYPQHVFGTSFGTTTTVLGYDTEVSMVSSYGSDYIKFENLKGGFFSFFKFDGDDRATVPVWIREDMDDDGDLEWYSTPGPVEADLLLFATVDLTGLTEAELSFDTYFEIEPLWDFGFVQVSTDSGITWTSLENEATTSDHDPNAHPTVLANLPGLTGYTETWMNLAFDLTPFVGGEVMLAFRYVTDWAFNELGWWVDDISLNGEVIDNADETVIFEVPLGPLTDFMVTFIRADKWRGKTIYMFMDDMYIDHEDETGIMWSFPYASGNADLYMIISPLQGPADYEFSQYKHLFTKCY